MTDRDQKIKIMEEELFRLRDYKSINEEKGKNTISAMKEMYFQVFGKNVEENFLPEQLALYIKEYFERIISVMPGHVYWQDKNNVFLGCNDQQAKNAFLGSRYDILNKTNYDMPWKDQAKALNDVNNEVMKKNKPITVEEFAIMANGPRIYLSQKVPLHDHHGSVSGILGISVDITDLKNNQKEIEELKVREAHFKAMSSIGGMMAHELRTPLASIEMHAQNLKSCLPALIKNIKLSSLDGEAKTIKDSDLRYLEELPDIIERSAKCANKTVSTILAGFHHSSSEVSPLEEVDINKLIMSSLKDYPMQQNDRSLIHFSSKKVVKTFVSPDIISHVIQNLLKNALYAIKKQGKGEIYVSTKENSDNTIQIVFKDTGTGIPKAVMQNIFDPFFSTKDKETSIGLGLYFCKLALSKMEATIECHSQPGEYTIFNIVLQGNIKDK